MNEIYDLKKIAEDVLEKLKKSGADKSSCSVSYGEKREFTYDDGDFSLFRTLFSTSISIMAIKDGKKGSAAINSFDAESIDKAITDCFSIADASEHDDAWDIAPKISNGVFFDGDLEPDTEKLFMRTKELADDISKLFPKIVIEQITSEHSAVHNLYLNSNGAMFDVFAGDYVCVASYTAHDGENTSSFCYSEVVTRDLDMPFIETSSFMNDLGDTEKQLTTRSIDGKFVGDIILTPDCLSGFLGDALSIFASGSGVLDGTALWLDKLDKKVTDERLTVRLTVDDDRLSVRDYYTSEGYPAESYNIIENGILKNFDISNYISKKTGYKRAPNDSGFFVIEPGTDDLSDMIANTRKGLIVARFSGGEPSSNGDFSGVAKNSFIVENGKIVSAAAETMISGNINDLFNNVLSISKETMCNGTSILPYMSFKGVTISGK